MAIRLHRLTIILDEALQPVGMTVTTDYDQRHARHTPHSVGPFDTIGEVVQRGLADLDVQLTLW